MFRARLLLFVGLTLLAEQGAALEIGPGQDGLCKATLSGEITQGDADAIAALTLEQPTEWPLAEDGRWKSLCLDSDGGDFREALAIARQFTIGGFGTVVAAGARCTDECALVFMFGTAAQGQTAGLTNRQLHVSGSLAFRRPELAWPEAETAEATDRMVQTMLGFYALAARPRPEADRPYIDADLVEMIQTLSADEQVDIDTVNKAGRWDIQLTGFTAPSLSDRAFFHACQNMTIWPQRLAGGQVPFERNDDIFELSVSSWTAGGAVRDRYDLQFASRNAYECSATVAAQDSSEALPLLCGYRGDEDTGIGPEDCGDPDLLYLWSPIPALALFPAGTTLAELADGSAVPEGQPELSRPTPCRSDDGQAKVMNVNNFTSLRAEPTVDSRKLDELSLGSTYDVPRDPTPNTGHPDHAACAALCNAANDGRAYDRDRLGACVDENWMWFRITGPKGAEGYASAKYLDF